MTETVSERVLVAGAGALGSVFGRFSPRSTGERRELREDVARRETLLGGSIAAIDDGEAGKVTRNLEQLDDIAHRGARGNIERCGVAVGVGGKIALEKREEPNLDLHPTCVS
jgi:hypothetical protein